MNEKREAKKGSMGIATHMSTQSVDVYSLLIVHTLFCHYNVTCTVLATLGTPEAERTNK